MSDPRVVTINATSRFHGHQYQSRYNGNDTSNSSAETSEARDVCQYYTKPNHIARNCFKIKGYPSRNEGRAQANTTIRQPTPHQPNWIIDT